MSDAENGDASKEVANNPSSGQYSHISCLLRALHQPILNVSRPEPLTRLAHQNIEEHGEEATSFIPATVYAPKLPVIFDIDTASESSNPPSPNASSTNLHGKDTAGTSNESNQKTESLKSEEKERKPNGEKDLQKNLEIFNKNVISVMDTLIKSHSANPLTALTPSASAGGKPFAFYHRMHRHSSAHSLNIPSIVVTGSTGDDHPHHHHKRFSFGLRRHSHAHVVRKKGLCAN